MISQIRLAQYTDIVDNELYFRPGCPTAQKLAVLARKRSFNDADVKTIRDLGYQIEIYIPQNEL